MADASIPTMSESCKTCRFEYERECRRLPPSLDRELDLEAGGNGRGGWWPEIAEDDWCGEYRASDK